MIYTHITLQLEFSLFPEKIEYIPHLGLHMARIVIHLHGQTKDPSCKNLIEKYLKRVSKMSVKLIEHSSKETPDEYLKSVVKQSENSKLILLDENGKTYSSFEFTEIIKQAILSTTSTHFAIGPATGFPENNFRAMSLSKMTFPHEVVSVILLEQVYRASEIIGGTAYHKS